MGLAAHTLTPPPLEQPCTPSPPPALNLEQLEKITEHNQLNRQRLPITTTYLKPLAHIDSAAENI